MAITTCPDSIATARCFEITKHSPAAVDYLYAECEKKANARKADPKIQNILLPKVKDWANLVNSSEPSWSDSWNGISIPLVVNSTLNHLKIMQENTVDSLPTQSIDYKFAVSDDGFIVRGASINDNELDNETIDALDNLLNFALISNNLFNDNGRIYQVDDKGDFLTDNSGQRIVGEPDLVKRVIADPRQVFHQECQTLGLSINTTELEYPSASQNNESINQQGPAA